MSMSMEFARYANMIPNQEGFALEIILEYCDFPYEDCKVYGCDPQSIKGVAVEHKGMWYHFPYFASEADAREALKVMEKIDSYEYTHFDIVGRVSYNGIVIQKARLLCSIVEDYHGMMKARDSFEKLFASDFKDIYDIKHDLEELLADAERIVKEMARLDSFSAINDLKKREVNNV